MINNSGGNQSFGASLGSGIAGALQGLAHEKVSSMQNKKKAQAWQSIGVPSNLAEFIVQQPEAFQRDIFERLEGLSLGGQQQGSNQEHGQMQGQEGGVRLGMNEKQKLQQTKQQADQFKATKDIRREVLANRKSAKESLHNLNRLQELSSSGKLDTPGYIAFLENSGLDIPSLMSAESQEFKKIQQSFLKEAKQYFGGRVSNYEVEQFLQTIPSLSQSPEGRQRVIAGLKRLSNGANEYYKAYEEVLKENGGVPPYDVEEQIERKADKRLDAISHQFKKDLEKPVPAGQNKLITALQSGAGHAIGAIPKTLKGAAKGAVAGASYGKYAGGAGALPGALAGAGLGAAGGLAGVI